MALSETPLEDESTIRAAQDGDPTAFSEIVGRERMKLLRTARAILLDRHEAEDVVQEALVLGWRALPDLQDVAKLRPWLLTILTRIALRRRKKPRPRLVGDGLERILSPDEKDDPFVAALLREVTKLGDRDRVPLSLFYLAGLSLKETAEATNSTEKAVKSRLHRIRARLRRRLGS